MHCIQLKYYITQKHVLLKSFVLPSAFKFPNDRGISPLKEFPHKLKYSIRSLEKKKDEDHEMPPTIKSTYVSDQLSTLKASRI